MADKKKIIQVESITAGITLLTACYVFFKCRHTPTGTDKERLKGSVQEQQMSQESATKTDAPATGIAQNEKHVTGDESSYEQKQQEEIYRQVCDKYDKLDGVLHSYTQWGLGIIGTVCMGFVLGNQSSNKIVESLLGDSYFFFFLFFAASLYSIAIFLRIVDHSSRLQYWWHAQKNSSSIDSQSKATENPPINIPSILVRMFLVLFGFISLITMAMIVAGKMNITAAMIVFTIFLAVYVGYFCYTMWSSSSCFMKFMIILFVVLTLLLMLFTWCRYPIWSQKRQTDGVTYNCKKSCECQQTNTVLRYTEFKIRQKRF